jgi:hypothetical protein
VEKICLPIFLDANLVHCKKLVFLVENNNIFCSFIVVNLGGSLLLKYGMVEVLNFDLYIALSASDTAKNLATVYY